MELKEFIRETLAQIAAGVEAAQTEVRDAGGFVNPAHRAGKQEQDKSHFGSLTSGQNIFLVDFDVTVTVIEATETEGKAKLNVAGLLNLGTGGQSNAQAQLRIALVSRCHLQCQSMLFHWKNCSGKIKRSPKDVACKPSKFGRTTKAFRRGGRNA